MGEVCHFFREMEYGGAFTGKIYGTLLDSFFKNEEWGHGQSQGYKIFPFFFVFIFSFLFL